MNKLSSLVALLSTLSLSPFASAANFNITGSSNSAQSLSAGETGMVTSTGTLSVSGSTVGVAVTGSGAVAITNSGTIQQTGTGRTIDNNANSPTLTITNNTGALIRSADADTIRVNRAGASVTLHNYGQIISLNASAGGSQAVDWAAIASGSNTLHNYLGAVIRANAADAVRMGVNGVVNNAGTIEALPIVDPTAPGEPTGSDGIDAQNNTGVQITNSGAVSGRHGITGGDDTNFIAISVTNQVGGTITGVNGSGINIDGSGSTATVVNSGTIIGQWDNTRYTVGDGDGVDVDGTVNITNNGIIRGINASGGNNAEGVSIGGGTVINNAGAEISGQNNTASGSAGNGLLVDNSDGGNAYAATSITNAGLIRGYSGFGIKMIGTFNDTVTNNAGGTIRGAGADATLQTGGGNDTVTNRGAIVSDTGKAIDLGDGNDTLIIEGGAASITGSVTGGAGTNTVSITPGAGNTFAYAGEFSSFDSVSIGAGTTRFSGVSTYTGATIVDGGTLVLDGANRLSAQSALTLKDATLAFANIDAANGQTFARAAFDGDVVLDLSGTTSLTLLALGTVADGASLTIIGYDTSLSTYAVRIAGDWTANAAFNALLGETTVNGQNATASYDGTYTTVTAVPEPSTWALIALAAAGLLIARRRARAAGR